MGDEALLAYVERLQAELAAARAEIARLRSAADRHAVTVVDMERRTDELSRFPD